jgi:hypothetical protein
MFRFVGVLGSVLTRSFASLCKAQHCQVTGILCGVSSLRNVVCIVYCICEADRFLLRVCTFTLRVVIMLSLEWLVDKYVHRFYNEHSPARGRVVTDVRGIVYFKVFVSEMQLCHCAYWLPYLMIELERVGLGTGNLSWVFIISIFWRILTQTPCFVMIWNMMWLLEESVVREMWNFSRSYSARFILGQICTA